VYDTCAKRVRYALVSDLQKVRNCDVIARHLIFCYWCNCIQIP